MVRLPQENEDCCLATTRTINLITACAAGLPPTCRRQLQSTPSPQLGLLSLLDFFLAVLVHLLTENHDFIRIGIVCIAIMDCLKSETEMLMIPLSLNRPVSRAVILSTPIWTVDNVSADGLERH